MAILIDENSRVIVQGITGGAGMFHAGEMKGYGTRIVAGTSPGKGGSKVHDIPVYDTVAECVAQHQADTSVIFLPAAAVKDAVIEAVHAGHPHGGRRARAYSHRRHDAGPPRSARSTAR